MVYLEAVACRVNSALSDNYLLFFYMKYILKVSVCILKKSLKAFVFKFKCHSQHSCFSVTSIFISFNYLPKGEVNLVIDFLVTE